MNRILPSAAREQLRQSDRTWDWKAGFRAGLFITDIVAIALIAAGYRTAYSYSPRVPGTTGSSYYYYGYGYGYQNPLVGVQEYSTVSLFTLIPLGLSWIWTVVYLGVLFGRKRQAHPGFAVGFDLVLTIGYAILNGVFYTWSAYTLGDNDIPYSVSDGSCYNIVRTSSYTYTNCNNGQTAITEGDSYRYTYSNGTSVTRLPGSSSYSCPAYDSCAQQDALVAYYNDAASFARRVAVIELVAGVFVTIGALFHLILFIWGCVDTHRYNRSKLSDRSNVQARQIAQTMLAEMRARGELPPLAPQPGEPTHGFATYPAAAAAVDHKEAGVAPAVHAADASPHAQPLQSLPQEHMFASSEQQQQQRFNTSGQATRGVLRGTDADEIKPVS